MTTSAAVMDQIARQVASNYSLPLDQVEQVIRHQWVSVVAATRTGWTTELSGLGYLVCSRRKITSRLATAHRIMDSYKRQLSESPAAAKPAGLKARMESCQQLINRYQQKLTQR